MSFLDRDGVRIFYEVRGSGRALLLTHGFSASSAMYAQNVEALARTHTVITWDLRGHGQSDSPAEPAAYSTPLSIGDMTALLDGAGAGRAAIVGHSLGGFLSLEFQLARPARVAALVLIGTGPGYRSEAPRRSWNEMVEKTAARFERKGLAALGDGEEVRLAAHRDASGRGLALAARAILAQHDGRVIESLPAIAVPTLIVVGEHDTTFLAGSRYMAEKIPGAELALIAGAGHSPNVTKPAEFHAALDRFLRERTSSPE